MSDTAGPDVLMDMRNSTLHGQRQRRIPGEPGIWALIIGDLLVFTIFFLTFSWYRGEQPEVFRTSQMTLNTGFGLVNTLVLLTSSLLVAIGVHRFRLQRPAAATFFLGGFALGGVFVGIKAIEYSHKIDAGIGFSTNDFYMLYFAFTGIHLVHVLIGMVVLLTLRSAARGPNTPNRIMLVECGAVFWHLVDLLWIVLFALFYLLR